MLERATRGEPVAITKHAVTKAYLISADQYHALRQEPEQKLFWRMYVAILRIIHGD
jgi:prevent-host-death family protein